MVFFIFVYSFFSRSSVFFVIEFGTRSETSWNPDKRKHVDIFAFETFCDSAQRKTKKRFRSIGLVRNIHKHTHAQTLGYFSFDFSIDVRYAIFQQKRFSMANRLAEITRKKESVFFWLDAEEEERKFSDPMNYWRIYV